MTEEFPRTQFDITDDDPQRAATDESAGLEQWYSPDAWEEDPQAPGMQIVRSVNTKTELWLRSSSKYQRVLEVMPHDRFMFSIYETRKKGVNAYDMLCRLLPEPLDFTWMEAGREFAEVWHRSERANNPKAEPLRWPVWTHSDDPQLLLRFCRAYPNRGWDRIVIGWLPRGDRRELMRVLEWIHRVAAAYPEVKFHYAHGASYTQIFGLNFYSADLTPSMNAAFHRVMLPNGVLTTKANANKHLKWIHVLGFSVADLQTYEGRVLFNIASARWAAEHWNDTEALATTTGRKREDPYGLLQSPSYYEPPKARHRLLLPSSVPRPPLDPDNYTQISPDIDEPYALAEPIIGLEPIPVKPRSGDSADKIACNSCSLAISCRYFREGAICGLPSSEIAKLGEVFGTRDADTVKDALSVVVKSQAERYARSAERWREDESDVDDLNRSKHLLAMEAAVVKSLEVLIKVLDPSYRPDSLVPALTSQVTHIYNPNVLVANAMRELESKGIDRSQMTPEVLRALLPAQENPA